ncbi:MULTISPECIES: ABC transporter ATP-binding protein [Streptomyces]|uniref:ABC transporter ATP-binding protein n=1 Tax=Streptomyces TaxID=1883 RepID=UPI003696A6CA
MSAAELVLEVSDVHKRYGKVEALRGVTLACERGEVVGLIGRNGAGKTSLVSCIAGLRRPDLGVVRIEGVDVQERPQVTRQHLGLAPQEIGVYPSISVRQNLRYFGELAGMSGRSLTRRMTELMEALYLDDIADRLAGGLSGGQKRRLHTAMAMIHRPSLLLLDEPTAGADTQTRSRLLEVVRGLAAQGTGVVYSSHILTEVEALGASVAILHGGRVLARGAVDEVVAAHTKSWVRLTFDGPAPALPFDGAEADGSAVLVRTGDPSGVVAHLMGLLGEHLPRLRGVDVVPASLESTYLALTGAESDHVEIGSKEDDVLAGT